VRHIERSSRRKEFVSVTKSIKPKKASPGSEAKSAKLTLHKPGFARGLEKARKSEIDQLSRIERDSDPRQRFWERTYLQAVYELYWSWPGRERRSFAKQAARLCDISVRPSAHSIRIIIDCTSPKTDEKKRSRWTLALRFALWKQITPSKLSEFLNEKGKGGIAGRAREYATLAK
jgi:hypothetical protein